MREGNEFNLENGLANNNGLGNQVSGRTFETAAVKIVSGLFACVSAFSGFAAVHTLSNQQPSAQDKNKSFNELSVPLIICSMSGLASIIAYKVARRFEESNQRQFNPEQEHLAVPMQEHAAPEIEQEHLAVPMQEHGAPEMIIRQLPNEYVPDHQEYVMSEDENEMIVPVPSQQHNLYEEGTGLSGLYLNETSDDERSQLSENYFEGGSLSEASNAPNNTVQTQYSDDLFQDVDVVEDLLSPSPSDVSASSVSKRHSQGLSL